ncbi:MAG: dTMP kinase [Nitrospirae bacterium]|nr:dTMP kinase [Nitrospirota bacterium]
MKGIFITFEGVEGSGKTTQIDLLANALEAEGLHVVKTQEPGGTRIGAMIRKVLLDPKNKEIGPMTELMLYGASRAQHIKEVILPAIKEGKIVLCDRFSDSTIAYQGYGRALSLEIIEKLDIFATEGLKPSLTILLDINPEKGLFRAKRRIEENNSLKEGRIEQEGFSFHKRVREGFLRLAEEEPDRIKVMGADLPVEEIHKKIIEIVKEKFQWH